MNEQALKERLKYIASSENRRFNDVWRELTIERLLIRLSKSDYHDKFIFKGGLLLSHYIEIGRETKDADFLADELQAKAENFEEAFREISSVEVNDGFSFSFSDMTLLDQPHMNYPGYRINLDISFGDKMQDRLQADVGLGDIVEPKNESLELYQYKGKPIFEGAVSLQVYPIETIFAEKLETIISKGAANSRMKDYHDLLLIVREKNAIDVEKLKSCLKNTFENRNTRLEVPVSFDEDEYLSIQTLWAGHRRGLGDIANQLNLPERVEKVVFEVNDWMTQNNIS